MTWDKSQVPYDYYETWLHTDIVPLEVDATTSAWTLIGRA
jgi:GntR family transcriptional regulator